MQKFLVHHNKQVIERAPRWQGSGQGVRTPCTGQPRRRAKHAGVCPTPRVGQAEGLMRPKVSDTCWLNDGTKAVFLYQLMIPVWLLWVHAHVGVNLPRCRCRQGSGSELSRGEQPWTEGLGDAPLNLIAVFGGGLGGKFGTEKQ